MTKMKFMGIKIPAKNPKLAIGIKGDKPLAKNETAVVEDVANIAIDALLYVKAYEIIYYFIQNILA